MTQKGKAHSLVLHIDIQSLQKMVPRDFFSFPKHVSVTIKYKKYAINLRHTYEIIGLKSMEINGALVQHTYV